LTTFSGSLDVLGPAGTYAVNTFGGSLVPVLSATMLAWVVVPATLAWLRFRRRSDL